MSAMFEPEKLSETDHILKAIDNVDPEGRFTEPIFGTKSDPNSPLFNEG